jgi:ABC-2 type transport system ATP-binding protein
VSDATIRVQGLTKWFPRVRVLDGMNLEVGAGERVALVGANGAGKTTLIRCLLGEYRHQGSVTIGGLEPRRRRAEVLRRVGFVPQLPPPLRMPVGRLVAFAASVSQSDPARIQAVAGRLGLDARALARRPFHKLSGGQKHKLLIAVALGRDCDVLLMDEPAANLDPQARRSFFDLLAEQQGRATMLVSSHRIDEVASLVRRVVELDQGRVILDDCVDGAGALDELLACRLELVERSDVVERALAAWGFTPRDGGRVFEGTVAGPDRLRFFGALARYSGRIAALALGREKEPRS